VRHNRVSARAKESQESAAVFEIINSNNIIFSAKIEIQVPADLKGLKTGGTGVTLAAVTPETAFELLHRPLQEPNVSIPLRWQRPGRRWRANRHRGKPDP
jgi:hypothetical protein